MAINPALISTVRVGQLPTGIPELTNKIAIEQNTDLYKCTLQDLVDLLAISAGALRFEIKTLNVNQTYIDTNFDATGLGRLLCDGFAICNGQNGTPNLDGLVSVGYGSNYNTIGGFGGAATHTLTENEMPIHSHGIKYAAGGNGTKYPETPYIADTIMGDMQGTGVAGGGQAHNNMQPYIIQLKIMKL